MTTSLGRSPRPRRRRVPPGGLILAALLALLVVVAGGTGAYLLTGHDEPAPGGSIVEGLVVDGPLVLLPPFAPNQNSRDISQMLDRGLTRTGDDGRPQPELARSWEVDPAGKTYTFHLRSQLQWSDGVALTSKDAAFTLAVLQDASLSQSMAGQAWAGISASTPDPETVVYTLPAPSAAFPSQAGMGLVPEHTLKPRQVATLPMVLDAPTSGPFRYESSDRDHVVLRRNPRSFEPARLDELQLRRYASSDDAVKALQSGDVDILAQLVPADAERVSKTPNRRLARAVSFAYVQVLFNQKQASVGDPNVRGAIAKGVDRRALIDRTLKGYARPDGSPIPPGISWLGLPAADASVDMKGAEAMLDTAGWTRPGPGKTRAKDGKDLELRLLHSDVDPYPALAGQLNSDLGRIGVSVRTVQAPEGQVVETLSKRDFDLALTPIENGPDPDIFVLWHSSAQGAGGVNFSGMAKDPFLDKALEDGRFTSDPGKRKAAYADAVRILLDSQAAVFLYSPDQLIGMTNRLRGVRLNAAMDSGDRYQWVQDWHVNTRRVH
jgi:peptide/nickel transport system substrate-binding protein